MTPLAISGNPNHVAENLSGIMVITHYDIRDTQVRTFIALLEKIGQGISTNAGSTKSHNIHRLSKETVTTLYSMSLAPGLASRTVIQKLPPLLSDCFQRYHAIGRSICPPGRMHKCRPTAGHVCSGTCHNLTCWCWNVASIGKQAFD